ECRDERCRDRRASGIGRGCRRRIRCRAREPRRAGPRAGRAAPTRAATDVRLARRRGYHDASRARRALRVRRGGARDRRPRRALRLGPSRHDCLTHRFFVEEDVTEQVVLRGEQAHQIANVLRLGPGDQITLVRNDVESRVMIESLDANQVRGRCISQRAAGAEPRVRLTLALPILRGDRTEEVIEAVTQLGVSRIVPFVSSRSVVRSLPDAKRERWTRVAREAAETARRGRVPMIEEPRDWEKLFDALEDPVLVAWESEAVVKLRGGIL